MAASLPTEDQSESPATTGYTLNDILEFNAFLRFEDKRLRGHSPTVSPVPKYTSQEGQRVMHTMEWIPG
jgi:hypothetical protein